MATPEDSGLPVGSGADPFAPVAPTIAAPPEGGAPPQTGPTEPRFVPESQYLELKSQVDKLQPISWIAEALAVPEVADRVRQAIFVGAPPVVNAPTVDPRAGISSAVDAIRAKYQTAIQAKIAEGDIMGVSMLSADMGAEISQARSMPELQAAAAPILSMTAQSAVENFYNTKRASSPLFGAVEAKLRAFVSSTPPQKMAELAQSGMLYTALESAYKTVVADMYESGYNKAVASGAITQARPAVPQYNAGAPGGGLPPVDVTAEDDKDDEAFVAWAKTQGISIKQGPNGALIGELK